MYTWNNKPISKNTYSIRIQEECITVRPIYCASYATTGSGMTASLIKIWTRYLVAFLNKACFTIKTRLYRVCSSFNLLGFVKYLKFQFHGTTALFFDVVFISYDKLNSLNQLFDSFVNLYFHCTKAHLSGGYYPTENNRPMSFLNLLAPPASFPCLVRKKLRVLPLKKCRDSFLPPNKVFINSPSERRNGCGGGGLTGN